MEEIPGIEKQRNWPPSDGLEARGGTAIEWPVRFPDGDLAAKISNEPQRADKASAAQKTGDRLSKGKLNLWRGEDQLRKGW